MEKNEFKNFLSKILMVCEWNRGEPKTYHSGRKNTLQVYYPLERNSRKITKRAKNGKLLEAQQGFSRESLPWKFQLLMSTKHEKSIESELTCQLLAQ